MIVRICDICNSKEISYVKLKIIKGKVEKAKYSATKKETYKPYRKEFDLCDDCEKRLTLWIKSQKSQIKKEEK